MDALSSVRAFVTGESLWSKAQKESVYHLNNYARSHDEADFQKYLQSIAVPMGDHKARIALELSEPDHTAARQGFMAGKNHPDDIEGMIRLFLNFGHTSLMEQPVAIWVKADTYINHLNLVAHELHRKIEAGETGDAIIKPLVQQIDTINFQLTPLEDAFSNKLGESSRKAKLLIDTFMLIATALLLGLGMLFSRRMVLRSVAYAKAMHERELWLKAVVDTSMDAVVQMDSNGIVTRWSGQAESIFGWSNSEAIGQLLHTMIIPLQYREAHLQGIRQFMDTGEGPILNRRIELVALRRDGSEFPVELTISPVEWEGKYEFCAFIHDITKRKQRAEQMQQLAHYDVITGLPNRVLFHDRLEQEMKKANRANLPLALMFLDIDRFKDVNDTFGHDKGDLLLKEAANRLIGCVRQTDTVARMGGDEFTVILGQLEDLSNAERVAQAILQKLVEPFHLGKEVAYVSVSIGITMYPNDAGNSDELLKNADQAMYIAKKSGRNRFNYFTPAMQEAAQTYMRLAVDMRSALAEQQYRVYYQPVIRLATDEIVKAEALIRWQHPTRGLIGPAEFIPIAEDTGMIIEIGEWVFIQAAQQAAQWRADSHSDFQISVNKSPVQFQNVMNNLESWPHQLERLGLAGQSIVVEITEGMLMDVSESTKNKLLEFRDAGIQVALDDFGTGYSSLSYLNRFDIDYIKIDKSFIRNLKAGSDDLALCEAIIVMAHKLGMQVIAEGVETVEQRDLLLTADCDYAQGYLFSKPVTAEAFETLWKH